MACVLALLQAQQRQVWWGCYLLMTLTAGGLSATEWLHLGMPLATHCCLLPAAGHAPTRKYRGTGLGLSICKVLVEAHGGTIAVSSKVGEGSIYTFMLPVEPPQPHSIHGEDRLSHGGSLLPKPEEGVYSMPAFSCQAIIV